jgi:phosphoribosylamine--glycine ligase
VRPSPRVGVVLASAGYPEAYEKGKPIAGLAEAAALPSVVVFHAGTARRGDEIVTAGGRVLTVVAEGRDYRDAIGRAYDAAGRISFDGVFMRKDIGKSAVALQNR